MRIMTDTNIFISPILFPDSTPSKVLEKVLDEYHLVLSKMLILIKKLLDCSVLE